MHASAYCGSGTFVTMRVCHHPQTGFIGFIDNRSQFLIVENANTRIGVRQPGTLGCHHFDPVHTAAHHLADHTPNRCGSMHAGHEIGVLREIEEEIIGRMRSHMVARRNHIRYIHDTFVVQLSHADIRKVIDAGLADRRRTGAQGPSSSSQIRNVYVRIDKSWQQPMAFEIKCGALSSRIVSDALNTSLHDDNSNVQHRRLGEPIDHIRMGESYGVICCVLRLCLGGWNH